MGEIIEICAAAPGWWVKYMVNERPIYSAVAVWVVVDYGSDRSVDGVDMSGKGNPGTPCGETANFVEFVYHPDGEPTG